MNHEITGDDARAFVKRAAIMCDRLFFNTQGVPREEEFFFVGLTAAGREEWDSLTHFYQELWNLAGQPKPTYPRSLDDSSGTVTYEPTIWLTVISAARRSRSMTARRQGDKNELV